MNKPKKMLRHLKNAINELNEAANISCEIHKDMTTNIDGPMKWSSIKKVMNKLMYVNVINTTIIDVRAVLIRRIDQVENNLSKFKPINIE